MIYYIYETITFRLFVLLGKVLGIQTKIKPKVDMSSDERKSFANDTMGIGLRRRWSLEPVASCGAGIKSGMRLSHDL